MENNLNQWNGILKEDEREKLTADINAIIKAHLNQSMRLYSRSNFSSRALDDIVSGMIRSNTEVFNNIKNTNALVMYSKLYMLDLLTSKR